MSFRETIIEKYVDRAVDEFDTNPMGRLFLRRLASESPAQFLPAALKHLRSNEVSNAHRFLAMLALRHEELTTYLVSPIMATSEVAHKLFKRFLEVDPSFDVKLARRLLDRNHTNQSEALDTPRSIRALDILDRHSRGRRLLPMLGHLANASDDRLAAKATLFVGRRVQSPVWAAKVLSRLDNRVRASAIESLWGLSTPAAVTLLERHTVDRSHRVLGNALVGLHIAGHRSVDSELLSLARTSSADRRSTAAWTMGKIFNTRWIDELTRMVKDEHPQVRSMALRSLLEIRRIEAASPELAAARTAAVNAEAKADPAEERPDEMSLAAGPELGPETSIYKLSRL